MRPVAEEYPISAPYGFIEGYPANNGWHFGIDYATPIGTPGTVRKAGRVRVAAAGYPQGMEGVGNGSWGVYMEIETPSGERLGYAHLSDILVGVGDWVEPGQVCYLTGFTGFSTGPHLHEQAWRQGDYSAHLRVNPEELEETDMEYGFPNFRDAFDELAERLGHAVVGNPLSDAEYMDFAAIAPPALTAEQREGGVFIKVLSPQQADPRMAIQMTTGGLFLARKQSDGRWIAQFYSTRGPL